MVILPFVNFIKITHFDKWHPIVCGLPPCCCVAPISVSLETWLTLVGSTDPFLWIGIKARQAAHAKVCNSPHAPAPPPTRGDMEWGRKRGGEKNKTGSEWQNACDRNLSKTQCTEGENEGIKIGKWILTFCIFYFYRKQQNKLENRTKLKEKPFKINSHHRRWHWNCTNKQTNKQT